MTHKIEAIYSENNCGVKIKGDPYLILNLESFVRNSSTSHCDFICVLNDGNHSNVFLVELSDISDEIDGEKLMEKIKKFLNGKIPATKNIITSQLSSLINKRKTKTMSILVIPEEVVNNKFLKHGATMSHLKQQFNSKGAKIVLCGENIKYSVFP